MQLLHSNSMGQGPSWEARVTQNANKFM